MGYITPKKNEVANFKKVDRHFLDQALMEVMQQTTEDSEGNVRTNAQRLAMSIMSDALYAETVKDRATMSKLIYERVGGKPAVIAEEETEDLPEVVFRVSANDAKKIKTLQQMDNLDEEPTDKVIVEIEGEPRMEF